jgi:hypothetical protein
MTEKTATELTETTDETEVDYAAVSVTVVHKAQRNQGPYEDPVGTVEPQESDELAPCHGWALRFDS